MPLACIIQLQCSIKWFRIPIFPTFSWQQQQQPQQHPPHLAQHQRRNGRTPSAWNTSPLCNPASYSPVEKNKLLPVRFNCKYDCIAKPKRVCIYSPSPHNLCQPTSQSRARQNGPGVSVRILLHSSRLPRSPYTGSEVNTEPARYAMLRHKCWRRQGNGDRLQDHHVITMPSYRASNI